MRKLKKIAAAAKMGLIWAAAWATVGFAIEFVHNVWPNPLGAMVDIWPAALAGPAFVSGVLFSGLLGVLARRRQFAELSLSGFVVIGCAAGALVSLAPAVIVATGLGSINGPFTIWQVVGPLIAPCAILGAISAAGTLTLARRAEGAEPGSGQLETSAE